MQKISLERINDLFSRMAELGKVYAPIEKNEQINLRCGIKMPPCAWTR
jgi:hypothetical protein